MKNGKYCEEVIRTIEKIEKWSFKTEKLGFTFSDVEFLFSFFFDLSTSLSISLAVLYILYFPQ